MRSIAVVRSAAAAAAAQSRTASSVRFLPLVSAARTARAVPSCTFSAAAPVKATTAQIKALRESSGAPITECRDAINGVLAEGKTDGSDAAVMQAAVEWLRKKGISTAAKKSGRAASEGLVSVTVAASGRSASLVEINSETDFAARNTLFKQLCANINQTASGLAAADGSALTLAALQAAPCTDASGASTNVGTAVTNIVANLRENIQLRRVAGLSVREGVIGSYMHNAIDLSTDGPMVAADLQVKMGRQGSLVALETDAPLAEEARATLLSVANKLAMQVVASTPRFVAREDIDPAVVANERSVLTEQANAPPIHVPGQAAKKPTKPKDAKQVEKMVEGRINKWLGEVVLLDQPLVVSGDWDMTKPPTVATLLADTSKQIGAKVKLAGMARFLVGEGVVNNKDADSFAKEVAEKIAKAK